MHRYFDIHPYRAVVLKKIIIIPHKENRGFAWWVTSTGEIRKGAIWTLEKAERMRTEEISIYDAKEILRGLPDDSKILVDNP